MRRYVNEEYQPEPICREQRVLESQKRVDREEIPDYNDDQDERETDPE